MGSPKTKTEGVSKSPQKGSYLPVACALLFFVVATRLYLRPLAAHMETDLVYPPEAAIVNTQNMWWAYHALLTEPRHLFDSNFFYPAENTLATGENSLGSLLIFGPAYGMTRNPVLASNLVLLGSFVLGGITSFLLAYYWTGGFWASLVAATLFAYSPWRFGQLDHFHLLNFYWTPLLLISLDRFLKERKIGQLIFFGLFLWMQLLTSINLGSVVIIFVFFYFVIYALTIDRSILKPKLLCLYLLIGVCLSAALFPVFYPYYQIHLRWGASRSMEELIGNSARLLTYLSVPESLKTPYLKLLPIRQDNKWLFPGLLLPILMLFAFVPPKLVDTGRKIINGRKLFLGLTIISILLAMGPFLIFNGNLSRIHLPYFFLYHWVPGFQGLRTPYRFAFIAVLAASMVAAFGFVNLTKMLKEKSNYLKLNSHVLSAVLGIAFLAAFAFELGNFRPDLVEMPTGNRVPPVYRWLARQTPGPVAEFPLGSRYLDDLYMYCSIFHGMPIVGGYNGYFPTTYYEVMTQTESFPSQASISFLRLIGTKWILIHKALLPAYLRDEWSRYHPQKDEVSGIVDFGSDAVWKLRPAQTESNLAVKLLSPKELPPGQVFNLGILATPQGASPWVHPAPHGSIYAEIEWKQSNRTESHTEVSALFPLVIRNEGFRFALPVAVPNQEGEYALCIRFPELRAVGSSKITVKKGLWVAGDTSFSRAFEAHPTSTRMTPSLHAIYTSLRDQADGLGVGLAPYQTIYRANDQPAIRLAVTNFSANLCRDVYCFFEDSRGKIRTCSGEILPDSDYGLQLPALAGVVLPQAAALEAKFDLPVGLPSGDYTVYSLLTQCKSRSVAEAARTGFVVNR